MSVGLFGQPAQMDKINSFAEANGLWVLDDAAQSFGTEFQGAKTGTLAKATCTSFFCQASWLLWRWGALFTNDFKIAEIARSCRVHGQGKNKYQTVRLGMTARLDTIQAAILLAKLDVFDKELQQRNAVANYYHELRSWVETPICYPEMTSSWAVYTIKLPKIVDRVFLQESLGQKGIPTAIYYPIPMHLQKPYEHYPRANYGLEVSEQSTICNINSNAPVSYTGSTKYN